MLPMDSTRRGVLFQSSFDTRLSRREISAFACSYSSVSHKQQVSQVKGIIKLEASKNCSESQCGVQSDFMSAATKPQPFPLSLYPFPFSSGRAFFHGRPRLFQFFERQKTRKLSKCSHARNCDSSRL